MWLLENWKDVDAYDIEIVGSDIDTQVLEAAAEGIFRKRALMKLSSELIARYFRELDDERWQILDDLRQSVRFSRVNIIDTKETRPQGRFDVIFCRNVLIYFDDQIPPHRGRKSIRQSSAGRLHLPRTYRIDEPHFSAVRGLPLLGGNCIPKAAGAPRMTDVVKKRILIVDDAALVRTYYRSALEERGFEVEEALNGLEGLEKILLQAFDLVIVDINMPQMDGITFLRAPSRERSSQYPPSLYW